MADCDETSEQALIGATGSSKGDLNADEAERARALLAAIVMSSEDAIVS